VLNSVASELFTTVTDDVRLSPTMGERLFQKVMDADSVNADKLSANTMPISTSRGINGESSYMTYFVDTSSSLEFLIVVTSAIRNIVFVVEKGPYDSNN
jgi:hypothetical protein